MAIYAANNLDILTYSPRQDIAFIADTKAELLAADRSIYPGQIFFVLDEAKYYVVVEDTFDLFYLNLQGVTTAASNVVLAKTAQVTVPAGTRYRWSTTVVDADMTTTAKLWYCFGTTNEHARNGPEDYLDLKLHVSPELGQLRIVLMSTGYFSGPFNINYRVN